MPGKFKFQKKRKKVSTLSKNWKSTVLLSMKELIQQGQMSRYTTTQGCSIHMKNTICLYIYIYIDAASNKMEDLDMGISKKDTMSPNC